MNPQVTRNGTGAQPSNELATLHLRLCHRILEA